MGRWLIIALGLVGLLCTQALAQSPSMQISYSVSKADYDPDHPGMESRVVYEILNTSPLGAINNMINFTLPTGLNAGAYDVILGDGMSDWPTNFGADTTFLDGTGLALEPGQAGRIELYSTRLTTRLAYATAEAYGEGAGGQIPFNPVLVEVPMELVPPGPGLASVSVGSNQVSLGLTNLWTNFHYTVEQSLDLTNWAAADSFWSPGSGTNWTATATNAPTQFYRVRTP